MRIRNVAAAAVTLAALTLAAPAGAQSAQPWSIQASLFGANAKLGSTAVGGAGFEAQVRYTPASRWSFGAGIQSTTHESGSEQMTLTGYFFEPRVAIDVGSNKFVPYLAGRLAMLNQESDLTGAPDISSSGMAIGAGAGLIFRASNTINLDLGVAMVSQSFGDATASNGAKVEFESFMGYVAKFGISWGFGTR
jgi:hypothetical protein